MYRVKIEKFDQVDDTGYIKEVNRQNIFEQVVEDLELEAVIRAVNFFSKVE